MTGTPVFYLIDKDQTKIFFKESSIEIRYKDFRISLNSIIIYLHWRPHFVPFTTYLLFQACIKWGIKVEHFFFNLRKSNLSEQNLESIFTIHHTFFNVFFFFSGKTISRLIYLVGFRSVVFGNKGDKGFRKSRNLNILYRKICEKLFVLKVRVVFKKNVRNLWWTWGNFSPILLTLMRPQLTCCVKIPLVYNKSRNILAKANIYLTLRYQVKYVVCMF